MVAYGCYDTTTTTTATCSFSAAADNWGNSNFPGNMHSNDYWLVLVMTQPSVHAMLIEILGKDVTTWTELAGLYVMMSISSKIRHDPIRSSSSSRAAMSFTFYGWNSNKIWWQGNATWQNWTEQLVPEIMLCITFR